MMRMNVDETLIEDIRLTDLCFRSGSSFGTQVEELLNRIIAVFLLLLLAPIMVFITLAVRHDSPGPAFYRQKRNGLHGSVFLIIKFRTMLIEACDDGTGQVRQVIRGDGRITRVGRFLRRSSLDELPQLINVLRGEMNLVGPRPHAVSHNLYYDNIISKYSLRHTVKPGLTGLAQIKGLRGETPNLVDMRSRVAYDLYYIANKSFENDVKIILLTVVLIFFQQNAR